MVVSYETLRSLQDELAGCPVGLLLADEGHRLKNSGSLPLSRESTDIVRLANVSSVEYYQRPTESHPLGNAHPGASTANADICIPADNDHRTTYQNTSLSSILPTQNTSVRALISAKTLNSRFYAGAMQMLARGKGKRAMRSSKSSAG